MSNGEPIGEMVFRRLINLGAQGLPSKDLTVFSCGGIYIPHRGNGGHTLHHILNMPRADEPVKLVTGARPRNILHQVLIKESLN